MQSGTYLITGITGYIGGLVAKTLMQQEAYRAGDIKVIGLVRNIQKATEAFAGWDCSNLTFVQMELSDVQKGMGQLQMPIDYVIHCAAVTTSSYMISNPVEVADGIVIGTKQLLDVARDKVVKSFVYISSMEVYGNVEEIGRTRKEEELGTVLLESARSCYPLAKRMAEHYCYSYYKEYGVPVKVARLAQTFGVGVHPDDSRVYMQFAKAAYEKKDIVLKTQGLSVGNYCAADDAVDAIFKIMTDGENGETYNVVNEENTMSIRQMAELVAAEIAGGDIAVQIEPEENSKTGYAPDTTLRMSGEKLRELGWYPTKNLVQMYQDVIQGF